MYACEAWRPSTKEGVSKMESVQKRALNMVGGLTDRYTYKEACRKAGMNTVEETLDEADMVRVFRILKRDDKVKKETFWHPSFWQPAEGDLRRKRFVEQ